MCNVPVNELVGRVLNQVLLLCYSLPQQAQTIESINRHTYIRKRILLTFFIKKLIL